MKTLIRYTLAATLAVSAANASHNHQYHHAKKHHLSHIEKRSPDVQYVVDAIDTVYELDGKILSQEEAEKGLHEGNFVVIGQSTPSFTPPKPPAATSSKDLKAQFIEQKTSTTASSVAPTSVVSSAPPTSTTSMTSAISTTTESTSSVLSTSAAPKSTAAAQASESSFGATGIDADFPSGKIKCSEFPSQYGAVALKHLGLGGWSGLQFVPKYFLGAQSISDIITGISGQTCAAGCMCSYACPAGFQKAQWPDAQGSTKQSIGGLYCNSDGYLELTRPDSTKLCEPGVGGIVIQNDLDEQVCTCRTDYPGTESMTIPTVANPGAVVPLTNPNQDTYYQWQGMKTSAQYYINNKGVSVENACVWNSPVDPSGAGNWAPVVLGAGQAGDGNTYISIFQNLPTSTALLNFNIEITGDVNSKCSFINGKWTGGDSGCTTAMPRGGKATVRYF